MEKPSVFVFFSFADTDCFNVDPDPDPVCHIRLDFGIKIWYILCT
jgi:hypothetical protein